MNTETFIEKAFFGNTSRTSVASVFTDGNQNIYSYGYHYPLLFRPSDNDNLYVLNVTGYSNTTSQHISKARNAMGGDVIEVKLNGARLPLTTEQVYIKLGAEVVKLKALMDTKKRKDTGVYRQLEWQLERVLGYYNKVKELV